MTLPRDTIYALSSGRPPAAIAVLRVSGPAAGAALMALAGRRPAPRRASLRTLRNPADGSPLDRALVLWFPGPDTATGEDVAELHLHGGRAVIAAVSRAIAALPEVREAEAGEFTRRAFLNRCIDLAAAEGLRDLLAAETETQRRAALAAAGGALGRRVEAWRLRLLALAAEIEAVLDFGDEDDVTFDPAGLATRIGALADDLAAVLARPAAERLRDGIRIVIAGPPNTGKSTLLNAIVERDAAIVSSVPGTTRDLLEVPVAIGGMPLLLLDTAGLRDSAEPIEAEGIRRAKDALAAADILLWLGEDAPPAGASCVIFVHARADLLEKYDSRALAVSVHDGWGVEALVARIVEEATGLLPVESEAAFNQRQRAHLSTAWQALLRCSMATDLVLTAEELRLARHALDAITGRAGVEDMLDTLFGDFCIGK